MSALVWSKPYFGVQHCGKFDIKSFWATVVDYGSFATCMVWTPGCGLSPAESDHEDAQAAREHAETQLYDLTGGRMGRHHAHAGGALARVQEGAT